MQNWMAPSEIAGLLLMRRVPKPVPALYEGSGYRVLGLMIHDIDDVLRMETSKLPSRAITLLPLHLRPALLAGVAIVQRAGPERLHMLRGHMMGENKARFPVVGATYQTTTMPGRLFHPEYRTGFRFGATTLKPGMTLSEVSAALRLIITDATLEGGA